MFKELKAYMEQIHATGRKLFVQLTAGFGRSFAITDQLSILLRNKALGTLAKPLWTLRSCVLLPVSSPPAGPRM